MRGKAFGSSLEDGKFPAAVNPAFSVAGDRVLNECKVEDCCT